MLQFLQTLQISFFAVSILGLLILGVLILVKPVLTLHRRLFLVVFLPLLAANPLALLEESAFPGGGSPLDWRLGLVLAVDLILAAVGYRLLRGWQVYGLAEQETEKALNDWCDQHGWQFDAQPTQRKTFWGDNRRVIRVQVARAGQPLTLWLMGGGSETRLDGETSEARALIRQMLPALRRVDKPYQIQEHMTGILYLVLAVVLAVLAWIFFFEPRLILID